VEAGDLGGDAGEAAVDLGGGGGGEELFGEGAELSVEAVGVGVEGDDLGEEEGLADVGVGVEVAGDEDEGEVVFGHDRGASMLFDAYAQTQSGWGTDGVAREKENAQGW